MEEKKSNGDVEGGTGPTCGKGTKTWTKTSTGVCGRSRCFCTEQLQAGSRAGDRRQATKLEAGRQPRRATGGPAHCKSPVPIVILPGPVAPPGSKQGPGAAAAAVGRAPSPGQPPSVRTEVAGCMAPVWPLGCPVHWRGSRSPNWRHHHGLASPAALPGASAG